MLQVDTLFTPANVAETERILAAKQLPHRIKYATNTAPLPPVVQRRGADPRVGGPILAEHRVYPKTEHGFAVRGNAADPHINAMRSEAIHDAIVFLKAHL